RRHTRFSRDWSSDVCSSDLTLMIATAVWSVTLPAALLMVELLNAAPSAVRRNGKYVAVKLALAARMYVKAIAMPMPAMAPTAGEIGRASCRERVEEWGGGGG